MEAVLGLRVLVLLLGLSGCDVGWVELWWVELLDLWWVESSVGGR